MKKATKMHGQMVDPNPTRSRTFILGGSAQNKNTQSSSDTGARGVRRIAEEIHKNLYPNLTIEEIEEMVI